MSTFSKTSRERLSTCHPDLQKVMNEVIKHWNCTILEGVRSLERQQQLVDSGASKTLNSKHLPDTNGFSRAVDAAPWFSTAPHIRWDDLHEFYYFAGFVLGIAQSLGIKLRYGGDWNSDKQVTKENFKDLVHFELI